MPIQISGSPTASPTEVKRFYLPGVTIETTCPACGAVRQAFERHDYLSYPIANEPFEYWCSCGECDHEWTEMVILKITLERAL